jgi:hypothetical protein
MTKITLFSQRKKDLSKDATLSVYHYSSDLEPVPQGPYPTVYSLAEAVYNHTRGAPSGDVDIFNLKEEDVCISRKVTDSGFVFYFKAKISDQEMESFWNTFTKKY